MNGEFIGHIIFMSIIFLAIGIVKIIKQAYRNSKQKVIVNEIDKENILKSRYSEINNHIIIQKPINNFGQWTIECGSNRNFREDEDTIVLVNFNSKNFNNLVYEGYFKRDKYDKLINDGFERKWYLNGQLKQEKNYSKNKLNGVSKWYFENGQIKQELTYSNGEIINSLWFDEDGSQRNERHPLF